ncbi:hypothetical protein B0H11DRAFT_2276569, partial [Mycena galericulata]
MNSACHLRTPPSLISRTFTFTALARRLDPICFLVVLARIPSAANPSIVRAELRGGSRLPCRSPALRIARGSGVVVTCSSSIRPVVQLQQLQRPVTPRRLHHRLAIRSAHYAGLLGRLGAWRPWIPRLLGRGGGHHRGTARQHRVTSHNSILWRAFLGAKKSGLGFIILAEPCALQFREQTHWRVGWLNVPRNRRIPVVPGGEINIIVPVSCGLDRDILSGQKSSSEK